jgi:hypothetical protein
MALETTFNRLNASRFVMQGLVDVRSMGCSSLAEIYQSKDTICHSEPLTTAFHPGYQSLD